MKLTPGARYFLEQAKAQGKELLTEEQAGAVAALLAPVRRNVGGVAHGSPASPVTAPVVGSGRGDLERRAS